MKPVLLRTVPSKASLARAANHFEAARRVQPKAVKGNLKPLKSGDLTKKVSPDTLISSKVFSLGSGLRMDYNLHS